MDLYQQPDIRAKAIASQRDNEVEQYNEQIELVRQQVITQGQQRKLRASTEAQRSEAEKSALGAFTLKGSIKDIKDFSEQGSKLESVKDQLSSSLKDIKSETKLSRAFDKIAAGESEEVALGIEKQVGSATGITGRALEQTGVKRAAQKALETKGVKYAAEVGSKAASHLGPLMNIGMGIYDGVDALQGDNWSKMNEGQRWETGLQIGAGVADSIGLVYPPLFVIGASLGALSSVAGVLGTEESEEDKVKTGGTIDDQTDKDLEPLVDVETPDVKAVDITSKGRG